MKLQIIRTVAYEAALFFLTLLVILAVGGVATALVSCSGTQLDAEMRAANSLGITANAAEPHWMDEYRRDGRSAADAAGSDPAARLAAVHRIRDKWMDVRSWWEVAVHEHSAYSDCLESARTADAGGAVCPDGGHALAEAITGLRCAFHAIHHPELDIVHEPIDCTHVPPSPPSAILIPASIRAIDTSIHLDAGAVR